MSDDERREAAHQHAGERDLLAVAAYGTRWGTIDLAEDRTYSDDNPVCPTCHPEGADPA